MKIIISRTDNLGDVILTLPLAGYLKQLSKENIIYFIGKPYTKAIIESSENIDEFLDKEELLKTDKLKNIQADVILFIYPDKALAKLAKKAKIPMRVGTSHRVFHWLYCNKRVNFSRKKSDLHESQLNFKLLAPLQYKTLPTLEEIPDWYGMKVPKTVDNFGLDNSKFKLIIHPKSKGSAREWKMDNYFELVKKLPTDKFQVIITGTKREMLLIMKEKPEILELPHVLNLASKLSLDELITVIAKADALVACSTGPLHIAAALNKITIGIYPPIKPMHPGRWKPIGKKANCLVVNKNCEACRKTEQCHCINEISTIQVLQAIKASANLIF